MRFAWASETVYFRSRRDVLRVLYCHEWMHWYLHEVLGKGEPAVAIDDDRPRDREALTRASPDLFRGEERIEHALAIRLGDAAARVGDRDLDGIAILSRADAERPTLWSPLHRMCGVYDQVDEHLI